jgi:hypothetical protein
MRNKKQTKSQGKLEGKEKWNRKQERIIRKRKREIITTAVRTSKTSFC